MTPILVEEFTPIDWMKKKIYIYIERERERERDKLCPNQGRGFLLDVK
jgi:hypothetical protein